MKHEWFVILKGKKEGPFSAAQLLCMQEVDGNTLAWREGMEKWLPIREIPDLKLLFLEKEPLLPPLEAEGLEPKSEDLVLSYQNAQPPLIFWIFFIVLLVMYALYQIYFNR